jgi:hypothetical protein
LIPDPTLPATNNCARADLFIGPGLETYFQERVADFIHRPSYAHTHRDDWNLGKKSIITQEASKRFFFPAAFHQRSFSPHPQLQRIFIPDSRPKPNDKKKEERPFCNCTESLPPPLPHPSIAL